jgi:hypothetical protein
MENNPGWSDRAIKAQTEAYLSACLMPATLDCTIQCSAMDAATLFVAFSFFIFFIDVA